MHRHPRAGKIAKPNELVNIPNLISCYYTQKPDRDNPTHRVSFGTSGHRGSSINNTFNENHILAITQAICDYRIMNGINGPLFLGKDTHALSIPAEKTAIEVLAANGITINIDIKLGFTPTPVISHAIISENINRKNNLSDGIIFTPSHNPPDNGGIKYNSVHGGPADTQITEWIAERANDYLKNELKSVHKLPFEHAIKTDTTHLYNYATPYIKDLKNVVDIDLIKSVKMKIGADALGGAGFCYWEKIANFYHLDIKALNDYYDPTFRFMHLDFDGKIRMDCSSKCAMVGLISHRDQYDISFGNDTDFDRHGIVTKTGGLMDPNHYLSVAIWYLFQNRENWSTSLAIGKTLVSSSMIDRVANHLNRKVQEVPVGFKWFVSGLKDGSFGFGGEESAGASFLRKDGSVWTTDKDGIIMCLLAAEISAKTGKNPAEIYTDLTKKFGNPVYKRKDFTTTTDQKEKLKHLTADKVKATSLAGEKIISKITKAPANDQPIGGIKVTTANGWFAARPSGTEDIYKIYAESFVGPDHLNKIIIEAEKMVNKTLSS